MQYLCINVIYVYYVFMFLFKVALGSRSLIEGLSKERGRLRLCFYIFILCMYIMFDNRITHYTRVNILNDVLMNT